MVSLGHTEIWNTPKPALPTGLAAETNFGERSVALAWDDPLNPSITRWEYQMKQGPADWGDWLRVDPSDWSTTSYTVGNLTRGVTYQFKVQAVNWSGTAESEAVEVTLAGPPGPPEVTASEGHEKVVLSWTPGDANGSAIQRHELRYSGDGGTTWNPDWRTHSVRSDTIGNLINDTEYTFQMRARNEVDYSEVAEVRATPRHPIRGRAAVDFAEHRVDTVATYRFRAPASSAEVTYRLEVSDIEDSTHFELSAQGGLSFRVAPNFEAAGDANGDNLYGVWLEKAGRGRLRPLPEALRPPPPEAAECLEKDRDVLFTFYDFPAAHWVHLRTTNPIESTFATVRHRTRQTRGCGSRITTLTMVFKLATEAEKHWRRLNGHQLIPHLVDGDTFLDGELQLKEAA